MIQSNDNSLICTTCGDRYSLDEPIWRCDCGGLLDIHFAPVFDLNLIKSRKPNLWRYREAIAVRDGAEAVSFEEGFTPLLPIFLGHRQILVKQEHLFPTGSYKDRGASVLITQAKALGIKKVVEDSSGNAGCAIAAYCAKAEMECDIYVPADTSAGKLAQIVRYGANLHQVPGTREDTSAAVFAAAQQNYYASHSWNPFFFQGTKTFAFEVCEQLGWKSPDTVVLPAGNGTLLLGAEIGFRELVQAGITQKIPRFIAVQAAVCAPLAVAFEHDEERQAPITKKDTLAEGIAIADPVRGWQILRAVRESGGRFIQVTEDEIRSALIQVCKMGYYIEPTSAATVAGAEKYLAEGSPDEVIVSVFSGHGLKTTDKIMKL